MDPWIFGTRTVLQEPSVLKLFISLFLHMRWKSIFAKYCMWFKHPRGTEREKFSPEDLTCWKQITENRVFDDSFICDQLCHCHLLDFLLCFTVDKEDCMEESLGAVISYQHTQICDWRLWKIQRLQARVQCKTQPAWAAGRQEKNR